MSKPFNFSKTENTYWKENEIYTVVSCREEQLPEWTNYIFFTSDGIEIITSGKMISEQAEELIDYWRENPKTPIKLVMIKKKGSKYSYKLLALVD